MIGEPESKPTVGIDSLMQLVTYAKYIDDILANHTKILNNLKGEINLIKKELGIHDARILELEIGES